jgi:uncharacterized phage-associated protein
VARATYIALELGQRDLRLPEVKNIADFYQISPVDLIENKISGQEATKNIKFKKKKGYVRQTNFALDQDKFRDVLLYVLEKVGAKPNVGETVIYKLLYFIDFDFYEKTGRSITDMNYVKLPYGPVPKQSQFLAVIQKMVDDRELEIVKTKIVNYEQKRYLPGKKADLRNLQADELEHINSELERLGNKNAREISDLSHKDTPWIASEIKQVIPYQLAMYRTSDTSVVSE